MIVGIKGEIVYKEPTVLHIFVNGLTYEVKVSLNTSATLKEGDRDINLKITEIIREDSYTLYGFLTKDEKRMFDTLIKINGIGPKVALAICSTFLPTQFAEIISSKDSKSLKKVSGIGPKAANRILIELADFSVNSNSLQNSEEYSKATMALDSLGFKSESIKKALEGESGSVEELIKIALKKLQRL